MFCGGLTTAQTAINVDEIIKQAALDDESNAILDYGYKMRLTTRANGKEQSVLYETFMPSKIESQKTTRFPLILLEKDGQPLSAKEVEKQQIKAAKRVERIEERAERQLNTSLQTTKSQKANYFVASFLIKEYELEINVLQLLQNCRFDNPRREKLNGRDAVLFDFHPRANFVYADSVKYLANVEGTIWIDAADKKVVRIEGFPLGFNASNKNQTEREQNQVILYVQTKVPAGHWFIERAKINGAKSPKIFDDLFPGAAEFVFSDYKLFKSSVESVNVASPQR